MVFTGASSYYLENKDLVNYLLCNRGTKERMSTILTGTKYYVNNNIILFEIRI